MLKLISYNFQTHYLAATQLESTGARKMFPCFDEPGLKAYFDFTVYYKYAEYNANWNMPIKEQGTVKKFQKITFEHNID